MTVILSKYDSAILKADMEFIDDEYVSILLKYSFKRYLGKTVAIINPKYPYNTQEEEKIARYEHENKRRDFIIRYLNKNEKRNPLL